MASSRATEASSVQSPGGGQARLACRGQPVRMVDQEVDPVAPAPRRRRRGSESRRRSPPAGGAQRRLGHQRREASAERLEQRHPLQLDLGGVDQEIGRAHQRRHLVLLDDADLRRHRQRGRQAPQPVLLRPVPAEDELDARGVARAAHRLDDHVDPLLGRQPRDREHQEPVPVARLALGRPGVELRRDPVGDDVGGDGEAVAPQLLEAEGGGGRPRDRRGRRGRR